MARDLDTTVDRDLSRFEGFAERLFGGGALGVTDYTYCSGIPFVDVPSEVLGKPPYDDDFIKIWEDKPSFAYVPEALKPLLKILSVKEMKKLDDWQFKTEYLPTWRSWALYAHECIHGTNKPKTPLDGHCYYLLTNMLRQAVEYNTTPTKVVDKAENERNKVKVGPLHTILQYDGRDPMGDGDTVMVIPLDYRDEPIAGKWVSRVVEVNRNVNVGESPEMDLMVELDYRPLTDAFGASYNGREIKPGVVVELPIALRITDRSKRAVPAPAK